MARRIMNWFLDTDWFRDKRVLSDKESLFLSVTEHPHVVLLSMMLPNIKPTVANVRS